MIPEPRYDNPNQTLNISLISVAVLEVKPAKLIQLDTQHAWTRCLSQNKHHCEFSETNLYIITLEKISEDRTHYQSC